jgi:hypothetical protein
MISRNKSELRRPIIEPGSPDLQSNALPIELTGRLLLMNMKAFIANSQSEHLGYYK